MAAMRGIPFSLLALIASMVNFSAARADDKDQYNLFNPTPRYLMREMSTDRPDKTESAYTVDAGHFQIEMDLATYSYRNDAGTKTRVTNIAPFNLKVGLLNHVDLQLVFENYLNVRERNSASGESQKQEGIGDLTSRLKVNLWGDDGGDSALAVMPFVKFPTNSNGLGNDSYEGGVIFPLTLKLRESWALGVMTEIDVVRDDDDSGNHADFVNSASLSHDFDAAIGAYLEFYSLVSSEDSSDWVGTVDSGITYGVNEDLQLDCGINVGVTSAADDLNPFVSLSWRY